MPDMRRRDFITLLGGAAVVWPLAARAQQQTRVWRVGCLFASSALDFVVSTAFEAFRYKMRELGYIEGHNLNLDVRTAEGDFLRLPGLAAELVALRPDLIIATATPAVSAVQRATSSIPIVMGPTADPIGSGFIKSLAKPGGNITGLSLMAPDPSAKSLEFLNGLVPSARRIGALMSNNPVHTALINEAYVAAQSLGLTIVPVTAVRPSDLEDAFATMANEGCDGLVVLADPRITARIPDLAAKARLPAVYQFSEFAKFGGLVGYGPSLIGLWRRVAVYVDKIAKGANPAELPVEQPTKFELAINLRTAAALGLEIPPTLLARADEVIE